MTTQRLVTVTPPPETVEFAAHCPACQQDHLWRQTRTYLRAYVSDTLTREVGTTPPTPLCDAA